MCGIHLGPLFLQITCSILQPTTAVKGSHCRQQTSPPPPLIARNSQTTYLGVFLGKELHILNRLLLKVYISLTITTDGTLNTDSSVRGVKSPGSRWASLRHAQSPLTGLLN